MALGAHRARMVAIGLALRAALDHQLVPAQMLPVAVRVALELRHRPTRLRLVGAHVERLRIRPLVGTPSALVTSTCSAPSTCAVDVPRTWRTPSTMWLKPWMY